MAVCSVSEMARKLELSRVRFYQLQNPAAGFEVFITKIHEVIEQTGRDTYYVFDSLSELATG